MLTEIDMRSTLREKLGADIEDYVILGACNPPLAHRAMQADRTIGLLLPCNVVVRTEGPHSTVVQAMDPQVMMELSDAPELRGMADEAAARLRAALDGLSA
ncbi:DUF302 domain-containing protein [Micromonospora globbae]|uniref:DUF302 domain-containing protein n=1 Tax=Micromonospora globbae TaxID=1894969 RepID=A0ABZ1S4K5_9ACTN|nr:DUF302 domain-containing protein [Micromonospora globbae]